MEKSQYWYLRISNWDCLLLVTLKQRQYLWAKLADKWHETAKLLLFQQRPFILNKEFVFLKNILSLQIILNTDYIQHLKVEIRNNITLFFVMRPWLTTHEPWMTGCQQQNKKWSIELTINFQFVFLNKTIMVSFIWRPIFE